MIGRKAGLDKRAGEDGGEGAHLELRIGGLFASRDGRHHRALRLEAALQDGANLLHAATDLRALLIDARNLTGSGAAVGEECYAVDQSRIGQPPRRLYQRYGD